jgi:two-component system CheB/CheR fusion protein
VRSVAARLATLKSAEGDQPLRVEAESLSREADRWLLARFAPASLLIDSNLTILQFRGRTGPFLEPASGPPSQDLRRVIRPELLVDMVPAIQQARETGLSVRRDALRLDERDVSIEVVPMSGPGAAQCFLILLDEGCHPRIGSPRATPEVLPESEKDRRLAQLQHETEALRDYLRLAIEEHGAIQEELKSANEELLSSNEEFQSTNEELETSREELQSTNEELATTVDGAAISESSMPSWSERVWRQSAPGRTAMPSSRRCASRSRSSIKR